MRISKKSSRFFCLLLTLVFTFSPVSFPGIFQWQIPDVKAADDIIISGYEEWTTDREIDGYVSIESGGTLVIKSGVTVTFKGGSQIEVRGKLISKGTRNNPVKFKREGIDKIPVDEYGDIYDYTGYSIDIYGGEGYFKNTEISGGGNVAPYEVRNNKFTNTAYAYGETGAIQVFGNAAKLTMDACNLHDNAAVIYLDRARGENIKVNRTLFNDNVYFDENDYSLQGSVMPNFKYNWWRNSNGPEKTGSAYKYITNRINSSGWLTSENFQDPVIIVPGILGSEEKNGQWQLDPTFHTYDNLYEEFSNNGYVPEGDLFTFPYDWRKSNIENANLLRTKINEIKQQKNWPKVDLVAHSMGGLIARKYIESSDYQNDVDQLITLGTPHKGSPKSYMAWEGGELGTDRESKVIKKLFQVEAYHAGYGTNLKEYIQNEIPSVGELLPDYDYLYDVSSGEMKDYPNDYPENNLLKDLNKSENLAKLSSVDFTNIVGNISDKENTISGYRVVTTEEPGKWDHGMPQNFYNPENEQGINYGEGDETIPLSSAVGDFATKTPDPLDSTHGDLPMLAQCDVIKELTAKTDCDYVGTFERITDILTFGVFSPIDIQVIAPDGKWIGKNINGLPENNQIPGAFYSGSGAVNEFLTIPDPANGEYEIIIQGTEGGGDYKIEAAKISEKDDLPEAKESVAIIEGVSQDGIIDLNQKIEIAGDEVINLDQKDETAPEITVTSPEAKAYLNNEILPVNFTASDDKSETNNIQTKKFLNGQSYSGNEIDLALENLGEHKLEIMAVDEAQNKGEAEINFQTTASINSILDNLEHYISLGLIKGKAEKKFLREELGKTRLLFWLTEEIKNNSKFPANAKKKLIKMAVQIANYNIDIITKYIQIRTGKTIDSQAAGLLIESLNYIKP
jgi:hypothetical protein